MAEKHSKKAFGLFVDPADGEILLTDKADILNRWVGHLNALLNRPFSVSQEALSRCDSSDTNT